MGWRQGSFDILTATVGGKEAVLYRSAANEWCPQIAFDSRGTMHVAFDTYETGSYDVKLASAATGGQPTVVAVAASPLHEARAPALAPPPGVEPKFQRVHPDEAADVRRIRGYRVTVGGRTYQLLRGGICASHTSGTGMGTDWRDNDPEVEPGKQESALTWTDQQPAWGQAATTTFVSSRRSRRTASAPSPGRAPCGSSTSRR